MSRLLSMSTRRFSRLALASSAIALSAGLALGTSERAHAQSFQGTPTITQGNATFDRTTPGSETITVIDDQTIITWDTNDTAIGGGLITFLGSGDLVEFIGDPSLTNFTVLNRIIPNDPTRAILMDGTIFSSIDLGSSTLVPGGNVWFYSPGGIVIGSNSFIDVGGLVLTTADPVVSGGLFLNGSNTANFVGADPNSSVVFALGSFITASPESSYVVAVAPSINNSGTIDVNGVAGLVAGEGATISFNPSGLFDIAITQGTDPGGAAIFNTGTIGGQASGGTGDNHRIYMTALAKNDAITMVVQAGSNLGFNVAGAADVDGNAIILSGGYDIVGGEVASAPSANAADKTNISIFNAGATSALRGAAFGDFTIQAGATSNIVFESDVRIQASDLAQISSIGTGSSLTINGFTDVFAESIITGFSGGNAQGGFAEFIAQAGGSLIANNDVRVSANAIGGNNGLSPSAAGSATGGQTLVQAANNATINITGNLTNTANATGGNGTITGASGGQATAGQARFFVNSGNGVATVNGDVLMTADAIGGTGQEAGGAAISGLAILNGDGGTGNVLTVAGGLLMQGNATGGIGGGAGNGGDASVQTTSFSTGVSAGAGTLIDLQGDVTISGTSTGGFSTGSGRGGNAAGGKSIASIFGAGGVIQIAADLDMSADAVGGNATGTGAGGTATGGVSQIFLPQGQITVGGSAFVGAQATGGSSNVTGGDANGGDALATVDGPGVLILTNDLVMSKTGQGGNIFAGQSGVGGAGAGGANVASMITSRNGGDIQIGGSAFVVSNGLGGSGADASDGGDGSGGRAAISQDTGGTISITGNALAQTNGFGGNNSGGGDGKAGTGSGGDARIVVNDAPITITGDATAESRGIGGFGTMVGSTGGDGLGGLANLGSQVSTLTINGGALASATGLGGDAQTIGNGGTGAGGQALIGTTNGSTAQINLNGTNQTIADASGRGGMGMGSGFISGPGVGGVAQIFAENGAVTVLNGAAVLARGEAGMALSGAQGDNAFGGDASLVAINGALNFDTTDDIVLSSTALINSVLGGGAGGNATGGNSSIATNAVGSSIDIVGRVILQAQAVGNTGTTIDGNSGTFTGGMALVNPNSGIITVGGDLIAQAIADAVDSQGAFGGSAMGGTARVGPFGTGGGQLDVTGSIFTRADAFGADGALGGGVAIGGFAEVRAGQGDINVADGVLATAIAVGGNAIVSGNGGAATGGGATVLANNGNGHNGNLNVSGLVLDTRTGQSYGIIADATGFGGSGASGGAGGDGMGGIQPGAGQVGGAQVVALSNTGSASLLQAQSALVLADGVGGAGGDGMSGGNGGGATGGTTLVLGTAGNGTVNIGNLVVRAIAAGGNGGNGSVDAGGNGGNAVGGFNQFGTSSGPDTPDNIGSATFGTVMVTASATGGNGGNGVSSASAGTGGTATGGANTLLVRGSTVTTGDVTMTAGAIGGAGGTIGVGSIGGEAASGANVVLVTKRFNRTERGNLDAGVVSGIASAVGGNGGAVNGNSFVNAGSGLIVTQSDATLDALSLSASAINGPNSAGALDHSGIVLIDSTTTIGGVFSLATDAFMTVFSDNATLTADNVALDARNFVADPVNTSFITGPGLIIGNSGITLNSLDSVLAATGFSTAADFNVNAPNSVEIIDVFAGGLVNIGAGNIITGSINAGNHVTLDASATDVQTGDILAGNFIDIQAAGGISTGTLGSTSAVTLFSTAGNISAGTINAVGFVGIEADGGDVSLANILTNADVEVDATGSLTAGPISAGSAVNLTAFGTLTVGNIVAEQISPASSVNSVYGIGLVGLTGLFAGALSAPSHIGLLSTAGIISTGALTTDQSVLALGSMQVSLGQLSTGTGSTDFLYVADSSMAALLGPDFENDPSVVFNTAPVAMAGSINLGGTVDTGNIVLSSLASITALGNATASGSALVNGGSVNLLGLTAPTSITIFGNSGAIQAGNLVSSGDVRAVGSGDVTLGNVNGLSIDLISNMGSLTAGDLTSLLGIEFDGLGGSATVGNIIATENVAGDALGNIVAGNIDTDGFVGLVSTDGSVSAGNIDAGVEIGLVAGGSNISAGNLTTPGIVLALADNDIDILSVSSGTGALDFVYFADATMLAQFDQAGFDPAVILATMPVRTAGRTEIGTISTGSFISASETFINSGSITASQMVNIDTLFEAAFLGQVLAPRINISSGDIEITDGAGLGDEDTLELNIIATPSSAVMFGDPGPTAWTSYLLDATELATLRAESITFSAPNLSSSTFLDVGTLNLVGSNGTTPNLIGPDGSLTVSTFGTLRVIGNATFASMASGNSVNLSGGEIQVVANTGGLFLQGNSPGGILNLTGENIYIVSDAILSELADDPDYAGRDAALAISLSTPRPDGVVQAAVLNFNVTQRLLIQNTGASGTAAGFLTYDDGFNVIGPDVDPVDMVVWGQVLDSQGTPITNGNTRDAIYPGGAPSTFTANSAINGCLLTASTCTAVPPDGPDVDPDTETETPTVIATVEAQEHGKPKSQTEEDEQEEEERAAEEAAKEATRSSSPILRPVSIVNARRLAVEPDVNEPVTSGGNPNLQGEINAPGTSEGGE
ncbi:MAG: hypothetical protein R3E02_00220 [Blastomonas sp.]